MQPEELDAIAETIAETVKAHTSPLVERLDVLAAREPLVGPEGPSGKDGRDGVAGVDAPPVDIQEVAKHAAALVPIPKDGRDGAAADVDLIASTVLARVSDLVVTLVAQEVAKAVDALERPKDGLNGRDGVDGNDGQSVTLDQVSAVIAAEVTKAVDALPRAKDGTPGQDGVGVAGALIDHAGHLVLTLSSGRLQPLGAVVGAKGEPGKDGLNGKDGVDGVGFDDLSVDHDGERTVSLVFTQGERVKSFPVTFPVQIHRGVFSVTKTYERGDCSTWGGSTWQAIRPTSGFKPGDGPTEKTGWLLVTKAGRDGRSGKDGDPGKPGLNGKDGGPKW